MKYFEPGDILLSDFDGVYLDSQRHFSEFMKEEKSLELWTKYLNSINWREFLRECKEMPKATETFLELQELGILRGFITRIHSFDEGIEKCNFIREKGFIIPIYYVLPEQSKSDVYRPNKKIILLDDKEENALDWEKNDGKSLVFNPYSISEGKRLVKKLDDLLTK